MKDIVSLLNVESINTKSHNNRCNIHNDNNIQLKNKKIQKEIDFYCNNNHSNNNQNLKIFTNNNNNRENHFDYFINNNHQNHKAKDCDTNNIIVVDGHVQNGHDNKDFNQSSSSSITSISINNNEKYHNGNEYYHNKHDSPFDNINNKSTIDYINNNGNNNRYYRQSLISISQSSQLNSNNDNNNDVKHEENNSLQNNNFSHQINQNQINLNLNYYDNCLPKYRQKLLNNQNSTNLINLNFTRQNNKSRRQINCLDKSLLITEEELKHLNSRNNNHHYFPVFNDENNHRFVDNYNPAILPAPIYSKTTIESKYINDNCTIDNLSNDNNNSLIDYQNRKLSSKQLMTKESPLLGDHNQNYSPNNIEKIFQSNNNNNNNNHKQQINQSTTYSGSVFGSTNHPHHHHHPCPPNHQHPQYHPPVNNSSSSNSTTTTTSSSSLSLHILPKTISIIDNNTQPIRPQRHIDQFLKIQNKQQLQQQQQQDLETYTELLRYRSHEYFNRIAQQQQQQQQRLKHSPQISGHLSSTNDSIYNVHHPPPHQQLQQNKLFNSQSLLDVQQFESNQNLLISHDNNNCIIANTPLQQGRLTKEFESLRDLSIQSPKSSSITESCINNNQINNYCTNNSATIVGTHHHNRNPFVYSMNPNNNSSSLLRSNSSLSLGHHQRNRGQYLLPLSSNVHLASNISATLSSTKNSALSLMSTSISSTTSATITTNGCAAPSTIDRRSTAARNVIGASASSSSSTTPSSSNFVSNVSPIAFDSSSSSSSILQNAYSYQQAKVAQHMIHSPELMNDPALQQSNKQQSQSNRIVSTNSVSAPTTPQKASLSRSNSSDAPKSSSSTPLQSVPIHLYQSNNNSPQTLSSSSTTTTTTTAIFGHPQHFSNISQSQRYAIANSSTNSMNISRSSNSLIAYGLDAVSIGGNNNVENLQPHQQQARPKVITDALHHNHQPYGTVLVPPPNNNSVHQQQQPQQHNMSSGNFTKQATIAPPTTTTAATKFNNSSGLSVITPITTTNTTSYNCYMQRFPIVSMITSATAATTTTITSTTTSTIMSTSLIHQYHQQHQQPKMANNHPQQQLIMNNSSCRSFFQNNNNPTNLFEIKKNKFFGSVSSIDLQCLKESQKVSVIERKPSSSGGGGTSTSTANNTVATNNNKINTIFGGRHDQNQNQNYHSNLLKSNSSSSTSGGGSGGGGGSNSSSSSAASNFFKLFSSSSKAKIPSFGFGSTSSASINNNKNNVSNLQNNFDQYSTATNSINNNMGGSGSSTISSNSSLNTVTVRADSMLSCLNDSKSNNSIDHQTYDKVSRFDHRQQHQQQQQQCKQIMNGNETRLTIKSISVDSANTDANSMITSIPPAIIEPVMPSNEILFRKYFTFYDLLSSINLHRLFQDNSMSNLDGPCSSLLDLARGTTPTNTMSNMSSSNQPITSFESSTLSSTSSYSSCTSSMSSSSHHPNNVNYNHSHYNSQYHQAFPVTMNQNEIGNELLAPSPNFLNEIGCERQYSIELTWNNGFKEEIPSSMLQREQHEEVSFDSPSSAHLMRNTLSTEYSNKNSSSSSTDCQRQFHPPAYSKRINIFSDASPFAAYTQHSVMSDLYGGITSSGTLPLNHSHSAAKKLSDLDFQDLDDGFGSLSSASLTSTYPGLTNLIGGGSQSSTFQSSHHPAAHSRCPFSSAAETCNLLEMDYGTSYYRTHFRDFEHQNWLQINDKFGPIIVSLRKERVKTTNNSATSSSSSSSSNSSSSSSNSSSSCVTVRWRVIVRTTSLIPLRGTIATLPSLCLPTGAPGSNSLDASNSANSRRSNNSDHFNINSVRDVLTLVVPKSVNVSNFKLGSPTVISQLLKLDEMSQNTEYKIGVLYAYGNQHSEEEFYNNILDYSTSSRSSFYDFMSIIASRIRLKDFKGYKAGLDVLNDTTGEHSWTAKFGHTEIMFHVCTELPFNSTNRQQLPRKRHIGNDIVTIVFLHENFTGPPFTPALIRSKFQQVFIVVKPFQNGKYFRVAIARHKLVPLFGPPIKSYYTRQELREFILTKIINAENACHSVNKFAEMAKRTRHEYLTEMCQKHSLTQTVAHVDSSLSSNSLNSFKKLWTLSSANNSSSSNDCSSSKHRSKSELIDKNAFNHLPYAGHILNGIKDPPTLNGAILFSERCAGSSVPSRLYIHDYHANRDVEVQLLLSNEAILVIEVATMEIIWAAPVTSIIGWTDSRGVFATSTSDCIISSNRQLPSTINSSVSSINKFFGDKKSKSVDSGTSNSHCSVLNDSSRELRLYYHQGECIQLMQKPINPSSLKQNQCEYNTNSNSGKSSKHQQQQQQQSYQRNNDPFLMLIRVLELITRKSELRSIVIKRKSSKTSSTSKSTTTNTPENFQSTKTHSLPNIEPLGVCGSEFGFQMKMTTGIIDEIHDQTLSIYHLVSGCKIIEIDKISFSAMSLDELQELVNSSLIMCLTFTPYDYTRMQIRCNCPWPKALQLQHKQKSQQTPPSDYENVSKSLTNTPIKLSSSMIVSSSSSTSALSNAPNSGVKTIHITHNNNNNNDSLTQQPNNDSSSIQQSSSTLSTNYSTNPMITNHSDGHSQQQSPSYTNNNNTNHHQLYATKSATSLNHLFSQQQQQPSSIKIASSSKNLSSVSLTNAGFQQQQQQSSYNNNNNNNNNNRALQSNRSVQSQQTAITSQPSTLKDNLIKLITMDDYNQNTLPLNSPQIKNDSNDMMVGSMMVDCGQETVDDTNKNLNCMTKTIDNTLMNNSRLKHRYSNGETKQHDTESTYSFYSTINSRYSTASQHSSLSHTSSGSNAQTTIHVNGNHITVPVISGHHQQQQQTLMVRTGPYGKESDAKNSVNNSTTSSAAGNNDCYLLTAQPVRVDSASGTSTSTVSSTSNNQRHQTIECNSNNINKSTNSMSQSYDCNSLYQSILTNSVHSANDPIDDIVWPSIHSSIDVQSYQQARSSTNYADSSSSTINCDTNSNSTNLSTLSTPVHQTTVAHHLNEEVRKLSLEKDVLNDTISKLREENHRLHLESQTASQQLRKLTEWFFNSSNNNSNTINTVNDSSLASKNTTTISIQSTPTTTMTSSSTSKTASTVTTTVE